MKEKRLRGLFGRASHQDRVSVYYRPMDGTVDVSAFVLAGGKSSRMGVDKAFVEYEGQTLLARALDLAHSVASDVRIVGNRHKFSVFAPVVEDIFHDCGPLGGIHAALRASPTENNLMLAVDTPFLSLQFLRYLIEQARAAPEAAVVIASVGGGWQPLCAIYRRIFVDPAETALRAGHNKIDRLFANLHTRIIDDRELKSAGFSLDMFGNLNTPEELKAAQEKSVVDLH